jgi:aminopeptidase N
VPELTESEAAERTALIEVDSYDLVLDLTAEPVTSRTEVRFRCRVPGAETFADVQLATVREAVLNGEQLAGPVDGRLALRNLRADNVLTVEGDVPDGVTLSWFEDPDGGRYVHATTFPDHTGELMACFDQPGLGATLTMELRAPLDWECYSHGPVVRREGGHWQFAPVPAFTTYLLCFAAGPFVTTAEGVSRRPSVPDSALPQFAATARRAREHYEHVLAVPRPDPKYDIVFVPGLIALALSVPGLMLVNEMLLARMSDPDDYFAAGVCMHEVAHLWFGSLVIPRWWDDLWLDEALAEYLSTDLDPSQWEAFSYRAKARAYRADGLPGSEPVSSPVADSGHALDRLPAFTYSKGASVVRQAAALIGERALYAGLTDHLTRFARGTATLDDMVGCWSRASGRDLAGWADQWLRSPGAPLLKPELRIGPDGAIESFSVVQDLPRTHRIGIGLYDLDHDGRLTRRADPPSVELSSDRTPVPELAGQPMPDAIVLNDGDLSYTRIRFDDVSLRMLTSAAMRIDDPLSEAVCWNAAWDMVTSAELPAFTLVDMIARRLRAGGLSVVAAETLSERAIACAGTWAPPALRARLREEIASACLSSERAVVLPSVKRALTAGFAAAAESQDQLAELRSRLDAVLDPDLLDPDLRATATFTLAARGLATEEDLAALVALDPANGRRNYATAQAMRPDPAAKEAAWQAVLTASHAGWQDAVAHASGIWVPGQEELMARYRDRYFAEAVPVLTAPGQRSREPSRLLRLLFPATLVEAATAEAAEAAAAQVSGPYAVVLAEQAAILRQVAAVRRA